MQGKFVKAGLIGAHIQASRSPHLHESEARALGFRCSYQLFDTAQLGHDFTSLAALLEQVQHAGFAGVNITHPFKQTVIPLLNELSADAAAIGAVNTVVFADGKRVGFNTDCQGFAASFRRSFNDVPRREVVLLGAGGAGSAVAHAALQCGVGRLWVYDVERARAAKLVECVQQRFAAESSAIVAALPDVIAEADGLIQATPIGMYNHPGLPLPMDLLRPAHWVAEIIYFPLETVLLKRARALGCRTLDGKGMAVFQAAEAFYLFTGIQPDRERMLRSFGNA